MIFWIVVAAMTAAVAALLLYPLLRQAGKEPDSRAGEAAVYRDQLQELDRDLAGGLITPSEAEYARAEIGRRLIAVSSETSVCPTGSTGSRRLAEAFVLLLLPVVGLCLYLSVGSPDLPSQPLAARLANPGGDVAILIAKVERHLAAHPDDGNGWEVLAPVYLQSARLGEAETAYRNAIRLLGPNPARLDGLADTLMAASGGVVSAEAAKLLQQSLSLQPGNPQARFYLALALEQAGKRDEARDAFQAMAKQAPAGAPWLPLVNQHIAANRGEASTPPQAPGKPTPADVASAENMNAGDRQQMIRGMVESLDARLRDNPDNFEGWTRLIRSYAVLNEKDRAADALKRGLAAFPASGDQGKQLLALAGQLGIDAPEATP